MCNQTIIIPRQLIASSARTLGKPKVLWKIFAAEERKMEGDIDTDFIGTSFNGRLQYPRVCLR